MEIFDRVTAILSRLSGMETICPEQQLQEDLGFDSLQMVTLLMLLEENFEITLNESDMNPFDLINVEHVVSLVEKYLNGKHNEKQD